MGRKPIQGISIRKFAELDGCDDKLVRRAIERGALRPLPDGKLDPALVGSAWREGNRHADDSSGEPSVLSSEAAEQLLSTGGASFAEADRIRQNYVALLKKLEYDKRAAEVVDVAIVAGLVGAQYAKVRTRLLALPAEQAPRLHRAKTPLELQDALHQLIVEALEELTADAGDTDPVPERAADP